MISVRPPRPTRLAPFVLAALLTAPGTAVGQEAGANREMAEFRSLQGPSAFRQVLTREEGANRTVERSLVEAPSADGNYDLLREVVEETIRMDEATSRRTQRLFGPGADDARRLVQVVEEEIVELPDGTRDVVRRVSEPDLDGRLSVTQREVERTVVERGGLYRTEVEVSVPGINRGGFAPVELIERTERREGEKVLEVDETTYDDLGQDGIWKARERRVTEREYAPGEVRTVERVYWPDENRDLALANRVVSREWKEADGTERVRREVHSVEIPGLGRSRDPRLYRQIDVRHEALPGGASRTIREVRERGVNGLRPVERVIEEVRPDGRGGTKSVRTVQRDDGNGRLETVSVTEGRAAGG